MIRTFFHLLARNMHEGQGGTSIFVLIALHDHAVASDSVVLKHGGPPGLWLMRLVVAVYIVDHG